MTAIGYYYHGILTDKLVPTISKGHICKKGIMTPGFDL
jgi:hypothetical protein